MLKWILIGVGILAAALGGYMVYLWWAANKIRFTVGMPIINLKAFNWGGFSIPIPINIDNPSPHTFHLTKVEGHILDKNGKILAEISEDDIEIEHESEKDITVTITLNPVNLAQNLFGFVIQDQGKVKQAIKDAFYQDAEFQGKFHARGFPFPIYFKVPLARPDSVSAFLPQGFEQETETEAQTEQNNA